MHWMFMPFRRFADFQGRSRRMEYWMFTLFNFVVMMALLFAGGMFGAILGGGDEHAAEASGGVMAVLMVVYLLIVFIPSLAVQVRRFHDQDKSGWMVLLGLIPGVGGLILIIFMCIEGTRGPNAYGEDPKA